MGFIALATYFFLPLIEMSMLMMAKKRKRREINDLDGIFHEGKKIWFIIEKLLDSCDCRASFKQFLVNTCARLEKQFSNYSTHFGHP